MKRSAGFTLIELIIVIVILGILAVTAVPKFINMQGDARAASVKSMGSSITSAASMIYSKAVIGGVEKNAASASPAPTVTINSNAVELNYGYPTATTANLTDILDGFNASDWSITTGTGNITIKPAGFTASTCQIVYTEATATAAATTTVTASATGC